VKKKLAAVLFALLLLGALSGCGSNSASGGDARRYYASDGDAWYYASNGDAWYYASNGDAAFYASDGNARN